MDQEDATPLDCLLKPWIETADDEEAQQRLAQLIITEWSLSSQESSVSSCGSAPGCRKRTT
jgi:hypothetical protein